MFSLSAGTGILSAGLENGVTDKVFALTPASTQRTGEQGSARLEARERNSIRMPKRKVEPSPDALSLAEREQLDLARLYEKYKRPIHTYAYRLLGSQEDADDLTQEVFVRAFVSWNDLYDHQNLSPWLYRIATNLCVDLLRRRKRIAWWPLTRRRAGDQQFEQGAEEEASYLPQDSGGIPEVFEREQIHSALANMPEEYAIVLVLSAAQGLPYQEIATIVGVSPNAAATRISRAKRMFAEQYQRLSAEDTCQREGQG